MSLGGVPAACHQQWHVSVASGEQWTTAQAADLRER
jgi:hypothetical protein